MKKITALFLWINLVSNLSFGQSLTLDWAKKSDYFLLETTHVDNAGNFYLIGQFRGVLDVDFGPSVFTLTTTTPTSDEYFISKMDTNGNFIWGKKLQGYCYSIAVDNDGNLYLPFTNGISKLDSSGNLVWHKYLTVEWDSLIHFDSNNNIFLTGQFVGTVDFDPSDTIHNLISVGYDDVFVLKLDQDGNFNWVTQVKSTSQCWANAMDTDDVGNVYITGDYEAVLDCQTNTSNFQLPYDTVNDWFPRYILKLDASGNFVWAKKIGGNFPNTFNSLAVDSNGSVFLSDVFFGTIDVDPNIGVHTIANLTGNTNTGSSFLLKLDTNGAFIWVNQSQRNNVIKIDTAGNIYSRGSTDSLEFPGDVTKYDPAGAVQWTLTNPPGKFIDLDHNGGIFITGNFSGTYDFDPSVAVLNLSTVNPAPFVQKLNQSTLSTPSFLEKGNRFTVYPNPTNGLFTIESNNNDSSHYQITDSNGKSLGNGIFSFSKKIDLTSFQSGLYFINIQNEHSTQTCKLIKM
jgi:hypothetical protein